MLACFQTRPQHLSNIRNIIYCDISRKTRSLLIYSIWQVISSFYLSNPLLAQYLLICPIQYTGTVATSLNLLAHQFSLPSLKSTGSLTGAESEPVSPPIPFSLFLCSSLRRSDLRHFARLFWNQTWNGNKLKLGIELNLEWE